MTAEARRISVESRHRAISGKSGRSVVVKPVAAYESDAKKSNAVGELGATVPWPLKIGSHSWRLRSISSSPPSRQPAHPLPLTIPVFFGDYSIFTGFWYGSQGAFIV